MAAAEVTQLVRLDVLHCGECGISFAVPDNWRAQRIKDQSTWYCPNGHPRAFTGESEAQRLRRELERTKQNLATQIELRRASQKEAEHEARERRKLRTRLKHTKERIKNGVCPCCHRSFVQLAKHMATMHPRYAADGED